MTQPVWKHDANTRAGRVERGAWCLREGERKGLTVAHTLAYLGEKRGLTGDEIIEALDVATGGAVVAAALGGRT